MLDDCVIMDENRDAFRQLFSSVFGDFYLMDEWLGSADESTTSLAREYLRKLQLAHKVEIENGTLSTSELSMGQRRRLALLTAYLENRPVLLFDEWAADQDPSFKQFFYRTLLPEMKSQGKIVIAVTHDDAYFDVADHIFKLEDGMLVAHVACAPKFLNGQVIEPNSKS